MLRLWRPSTNDHLGEGRRAALCIPSHLHRGRHLEDPRRFCLRSWDVPLHGDQSRRKRPSQCDRRGRTKGGAKVGGLPTSRADDQCGWQCALPVQGSRWHSKPRDPVDEAEWWPTEQQCRGLIRRGSEDHKGHRIRGRIVCVHGNQHSWQGNNCHLFDHPETSNCATPTKRIPPDCAWKTTETGVSC